MKSHWSDAYIDVLRSALPEDLPEGRPIYLITAAEAGDKFQCPRAAAFTGDCLDFDLRGKLEEEGRWNGPGYAVVIVCEWILTHKLLEVSIGVLAHEISHSIEIESSRLVRQMAKYCPEFAEGHSKNTAHLRDYTFDRSPFETAGTLPKWHSHESQWIRTAIHAGHRLKRRGYDAVPRMMLVAGEFYGLSPWNEYRDCLDAELHDFERVPILDILKTPAPKAFEDLWRRDTQSLIVV